ncbi:substrate-binding domain-containing protein [Amnibacterium sp. CER49]|uniref:sugar ABC transporter substrate-binding protein n=1 Tax=Amnibacterium sp. CER49 TaxID=3039161 RepID=UPI002447EB31|nr:substrate-binding domain-containing protein [Amnibacterium sp. CER49]MDH2443163.1 substrate-binding domain-containing protein [Amnibacterium sp. CER49]
MKKTILGAATVVAATTLLLAGCASGGGSTTKSTSGSGGGAKAAASKRACVILPDTESSPRWENGDRPALQKALTGAGFTADIQNAHNSTTQYATIASAQLSKGCGVMLLVDLNGAGAQVLTKAHGQGVPVIAYDRPIQGADYYVSFDNEKVGELEGQMIVDGLKKEGKDPKTAKVVCMAGDPTDGNAAYFLSGAKKSMGAAGIQCAFSPKGTWDATKSGTEFAQAYTALKGNIDAVWTANDANNAAVITVLDKYNKVVPTSGQDASIPGLQNILLGKQYGTVYKPYQLEADQASKIAIDLLKGSKPSAPTKVGGVPSFLETPILTTATGVEKVVQDGNASVAQICTGAVKKACDKYGVK